MACWTEKELKQHIGHEVQLARYANGCPLLECNTCNEILLEFHTEPEEDNDGVCTGYDVLVLGPEPEEE